MQETVIATLSSAAAYMALAHGVPRSNLLFGGEETLATMDAHMIYAGAFMYVLFYPIIVGMMLASTWAKGVEGIMGVITITCYSFASLVSPLLFWGGFVRLASDL